MADDLAFQEFAKGIALPETKPASGAGDFDQFSQGITFGDEKKPPAPPAEVANFLKKDRPEPSPMSWGEVLPAAIENAPKSAVEFGKAVVTPFTQPVETAKAIGDIGTGLYSKAKGALGYQQDEAEKAKAEAGVNAIGDFYRQRYGSVDGFKRALAEDPVGVLSDAALLFTGGGGLAAKAPGMIGKAGEVVATAGKTVDPLNVALQAPKLAAKAATTAFNIPATIQSGAAFGSLQTAAKAGMDRDPVFWAHYSGKADASDLIERVQNGVRQVAEDRSKNYIAGMDPIKAQTGLDFQPVLDVIDQSRGATGKGVGAFYGETTNRGAQQTLDAVDAVVKRWMSKDPGSPHHTLEGFDALKQAIGDLKPETRGNPQARKIVDDAYNAVRQSIVNVDPGYAKIMEEYGSASEKLNDMRAALLSGKSTDTRINKILRSYRGGDKGNLLEDLYKRDPQLVSAIAGYDLSPYLPQGIRGIVASGALYGGTGALLGPAALLHPAHLAHVAMGSPKVVGGVNYLTGAAAGAPSRIYEMSPTAAQSLFQAGRAEEYLNQSAGGRIERKAGGRISSHEGRADRLVRMAEQAKQRINSATESLLDSHDDHIAKALEVAQQNI
jgi:hypothetical protein